LGSALPRASVLPRRPRFLVHPQGEAAARNQRRIILRPIPHPGLRLLFLHSLALANTRGFAYSCNNAPHRDTAAAAAFLHKAIRTHGRPEKITIDQSGANTAAITDYNRTHKTTIAIRQSKYLNNLVEQDHRAVKGVVRPTLGFKSFWAARCTIAGIEVMHAIRKG